MIIELPAKLNLISVSGKRFVKASAMTGNTSVRDEAADTVSSVFG
jgi:hypothetical protein